MSANALIITLFSLFVTFHVQAKDWTKVKCPSDPNQLAREAFSLLTSGFQIGLEKCYERKFKYFDSASVDTTDTNPNTITSKLEFLESKVLSKDITRATVQVKFKTDGELKSMTINLSLRVSDSDGNNDNIPCAIAFGEEDPLYIDKKCVK